MSVRSMFGPDWTVSATGSGNEHHLFDSRGKVAATGYKAEKMQYIADCVNRIAELEAIVAKLPHTADGVPVSPGMELWLWMGRVTIPATVCDVEMYAEILSDINGYGYPVRQCYSTPQAAEKASQS